MARGGASRNCAREKVRNCAREKVRNCAREKVRNCAREKACNCARGQGSAVSPAGPHAALDAAAP
jgi:hypothetical protein